MTSATRWLSFSALLFLVFVSGCGENGDGCAAPPEKEKESSSAGISGNTGSGGGGGSDIVISEKKSRKVPKPYQRTDTEPASPQQAPGAAAAKPPEGAAPPAGAAAPPPAGLPVARVTRRKVDGISNRVEVKCRIMAASSDGECSGAANYAEIKEKCCPYGIVERCKVGMRGVVLIGLDCEKKQP